MDFILLKYFFIIGGMLIHIEQQFLKFSLLNCPDLLLLRKYFIYCMVHDSIMTIAVAMDFKWASERCMVLMPRADRFTSVSPDIRSVGRPVASLITSIS